MNPVQTVLLVEDDPAVAQIIRTVLAAHPYRVWMARTSAEAQLALKGPMRPDLLILDIHLPDSNGLSLIADAKSAGNIPVVICSGTPDQYESSLQSLKLGADDFIGKPFDPHELEARVEAVLRRATAATTVEQVQPLQLTRIQYRILLTLSNRAGEVVSHRQLTDAVWGPDAPRNDRALSSQIRRLRLKLGTSSVIMSVPGFGYRLVRDSGAV